MTTNTEKKVLDRATRDEQRALDKAKADRAEVENTFSAATKKRDKTAVECKRHEADKDPASRQKYAADLGRAETEFAAAHADHDKVVAEAARIVDEITKARATRAEVYQNQGLVRVVSPSGNGMFQVSFTVGVGSAKRSITRHCRKVHGEYVTVDGVMIEA